VNARARRAFFVLVMLLAAAGVLFLIDACTIVNGLVVGSPTEGGGPSLSDAADAGNPDADPCTHTRPPGPAPRDPNEVSGAEVFAIVVRDISFGIDGGTLEPISFDLDGLCTCFPHPDSCKLPRPLKPGDVKCDNGGGGQDNAAQDLLKEALTAKFTLEADANESVDAGARAVLLHVSAYNGLANDSDVRVGVLVSPGLEDQLGNRIQPTYTTADEWTLDDKTITVRNGFTLPNTTVGGYVVNKTLVVNSVDISMPISTVALVTLRKSVLVAKIIDAPGGGHTLGEMSFAGRWSIADATKVLGSFSKDVGGEPICTDPDPQSVALYDFAKGRICEAADLRADPADDSTGKECDAVSIAVRARGAPAMLGKGGPVATPEPCAGLPVNDCKLDGG
jgi:hypothetical protein